VPLNPGKNITVIGEVIALNHLLRYSGVDAAEAFNNRLLRRMRDAADARMPPPVHVREYLQEDDE
jgi:HPr kinase/phosphorylase